MAAAQNLQHKLLHVYSKAKPTVFNRVCLQASVLAGSPAVETSAHLTCPLPLQHQSLSHLPARHRLTLPSSQSPDVIGLQLPSLLTYPWLGHVGVETPTKCGRPRVPHSGLAGLL